MGVQVIPLEEILRISQTEKIQDFYSLKVFALLFSLERSY